MSEHLDDISFVFAQIIPSHVTNSSRVDGASTHCDYNFPYACPVEMTDQATCFTRLRLRSWLDCNM